MSAPRFHPRIKTLAVATVTLAFTAWPALADVPKTTPWTKSKTAPAAPDQKSAPEKKTATAPAKPATKPAAAPAKPVAIPAKKPAATGQSETVTVTETPAPAPVRGAQPAPPPTPVLIPEDAALGRSELIQLALQADPDYWRFRGEIAFYTQAEGAAYDWEDPELRFGYNKEFERDPERPYTESRSISTMESGYFDTTSTSSRLDSDSTGFVENTTASGRDRTSSSRHITTETVRKITPGKYQDIIEETVYEVERRKDKSNSRSARTDGGTGITTDRSESADEYSRRRVVSRSREVRKHPNSLYPDEAYTLQLRLFVPNPFLMKSLAQRARAERGLSEARMRTAMRDTVFDVSRRYEELQFWNVWHKVDGELVELQKKNLNTTEELSKKLAGLAASGLGGLYDPSDVPSARLEVAKADEEFFDSQRRFAEAREELSQLAAVKDPSRILLTNTLRMRRVNLQGLDTAALIELARANRPDLGEMGARADVERARLREVKAKRIPWFNDVRVGWGRGISDGYRNQDEVTALMTMNLPLFSWWQNKAHRQHEEAIKSYEEAQQVLGQRVDAQVIYALTALRKAEEWLSRYEAKSGELREIAKKNRADAASAGDKQAKIELDTEEAVLKDQRGRLQWIYRYNQAVAGLELALGMPLEELFSSQPAASK